MLQIFLLLIFNQKTLISLTSTSANKRAELRMEIDILENEILEKYPEVLDILLRDQTTQKNIIWATSNYEHLGEPYLESNQIQSEQITGINGHVIMECLPLL